MTRGGELDPGLKFLAADVRRMPTGKHVSTTNRHTQCANPVDAAPTAKGESARFRRDPSIGRRACVAFQETDRAAMFVRPGVNQRCAQCHAPDGARTGLVISIEEIGTDAHRLNRWTPAAADAYNAFAKGYPWEFSGFRKTNGYVAVQLDRLWLRAPYLHNGSVASLEELLERPERRRAIFYRGYDVYDPERVGFVSDGDIPRRIGTPFDTSRPGNGNSGHLYGVELTTAEKRALIEFLKSL